MHVATPRETSAQARYSRRRQSEVAEIGVLPQVVHPARKAACRYDLLLFAQTYYPHSTGLKPFSPAHIRSIERIQTAILTGGYFLFIVFRGFAKSTIVEVATQWGVLYGHIKFPVPIACDAGAAKTILDSIKAEFETNDLLLEDFPEVVHPVRALEGKPQRCRSQTYNGELTHISWTAEEIVLPTIPGSAASGAVVKPRGITANLRGLRHKTPDGRQLRPDFVIIDDPQTDESARSPDQVEKRLATLNKAILRLGGHTRRLAAVCTATVIEPDDMVDRMSKLEEFRAWQVERVPMLESFAAEHDTFWLGEYANVRQSYNPDVPGDQDRAHREATELYRKHRARADKGAKATWEFCFDETEISAVQHAYNILIDTGYAAFMAECQNQPLVESNDLDTLSAPEIAKKVNGYERGVIPGACSTVTAFIDVQGKMLYWLVAAWQPDFTGYVVDYGTWPDQKRQRFTLADSTRTLRRAYRGTDDEGAIHAGLTDCLEMLGGREWKRDDGTLMRLNRVLVDANWGKTSTIVTACLRQSKYANIATPSFGRGIKATQKPISQWGEAKRRRCGPEWVPAAIKGKTHVGLIYDVNYWKQRLHGALGLPTGTRGSLSLYKAAPTTHRMLADHITAERSKRVEYDGRTVFEFDLLPSRDNHYLDCAVGAMVAASMCGVTNAAVAPRRKSRTRVKML